MRHMLGSFYNDQSDLLSLQISETRDLLGGDEQNHEIVSLSLKISATRETRGFWIGGLSDR